MIKFLRISISIFLSLLLKVNLVLSQGILVSPQNTSDFCFQTSVTYTDQNPDPNLINDWKAEGYFAGSGGGPLMTWMLGGGNSVQFQTGIFYGGGGWIVLDKYDAQNNLVYSSRVAQLFSGSGNPIPINSTSQFGSCYSLIVPEFFDPFSVVPWGQTRWAMWYKNGVPTGDQDYLLDGPLTDSAWYEYKVKLTCGDTMATGLFYFWRPSVPTISAVGNTTICQGDSVTLNCSTNLTITGWQRNGVSIAGTSGLTSIKATLSGNYTVQQRYSSGGGGYCYLTSNPIAITVNPGAFITSPVNQACNGDSILLTCTAANSYVWKKNGNVIAGANTQTIWVKNSGNYEVQTTGLFCNSSFIKNILFYANASVSVSPSVSQDLCTRTAISLSASGANISSYQWYRYSAILPDANQSVLTLTKPGSYKCVSSNAIGCTRTSNVVIVNNISSGTLPVKQVLIDAASSGVDAYTSSAFGNFGTNFGNATTLEISNWYKHFRTAERGYIAFDLSQIPAGSPIVSATLKLYVDTIDSLNTSYGANSLFLDRCIAPWLENTVTWNGTPLSTAFQSTAIPCSTIQSKAWLKANVLNQMKHWSYEPSQNFGLFVHFDEMKELSWMRILSSENADVAHRPNLIVKYNYAQITPSGPLYFCTGGSVNFTTNVGAYTYQWYKNNTPIAGATTSSYTTTTSGNYYVILSTASGCGVKSDVLTVGANVPTPVDIQSSGSLDFCPGASLTLSADSVAGHTFQWKKNNVNIAGAIYSKLNVNAAGSYVVRVTNSCGLISRDTVICTAVNNPAPTITASGPLTFCAGQNVLFSAAVYTGVMNQWRKNNLDIVGAVNPTYLATSSGAYSVVQTANGCSKYSAVKMVNVNCREGEWMSENFAVEIFPQPVHDAATIMLKGDIECTEILFQLYDLNGRLVAQFAATGQNTRMEKGDLKSGMYLLKTILGKQQIGINKILFAE